MPKPIERPKKGARINKLWEIVDQLVQAVNALNNLKVSPESAGKFLYSDANVTLVHTTESCGS